MSEKDYADLAAKVAALEERMETKQAEYRTDIANLARDIERGRTAGLRWTVGIGLGFAAVIIASLGLLIRL